MQGVPLEGSAGDGRLSSPPELLPWCPGQVSTVPRAGDCREEAETGIPSARPGPPWFPVPSAGGCRGPPVEGMTLAIEDLQVNDVWVWPSGEPQSVPQREHARDQQSRKRVMAQGPTGVRGGGGAFPQSTAFRRAIGRACGHLVGAEQCVGCISESSLWKRCSV